MDAEKKVLNAIESINQKMIESEDEVRQFTIDMIEHCKDELEDFFYKRTRILRNLRREVSNALDICDNNLRDYIVLQELYDEINDSLKEVMPCL